MKMLNTFKSFMFIALLFAVLTMIPATIAYFVGMAFTLTPGTMVILAAGLTVLFQTVVSYYSL